MYMEKTRKFICFSFFRRTSQQRHQRILLIFSPWWDYKKLQRKNPRQRLVSRNQTTLIRIGIELHTLRFMAKIIPTIIGRRTTDPITTIDNHYDLLETGIITTITVTETTISKISRRSPSSRTTNSHNRNHKETNQTWFAVLQILTLNWW